MSSPEQQAGGQDESSNTDRPCASRFPVVTVMLSDEELAAEQALDVPWLFKLSQFPDRRPFERVPVYQTELPSGSDLGDVFDHWNLSNVPEILHEKYGGLKIPDDVIEAIVEIPSGRFKSEHIYEGSLMNRNVEIRTDVIRRHDEGRGFMPKQEDVAQGRLPCVELVLGKIEDGEGT